MLGILVSKADSSPCPHRVYVLVRERRLTEKVRYSSRDKAGRKVKQGSGWVALVAERDQMMRASLPEKGPLNRRCGREPWAPGVGGMGGALQARRPVCRRC